MSVGGLARVIGDCSFEFVSVEKLSEDVGKTSMEVMIVFDVEVEFFGSEGQICNGKFVVLF